MNKKIGRRYKKHILSPGGTRDSLVSLKEFLGREPNEEPFLKNRGLDTDIISFIYSVDWIITLSFITPKKFLGTLRNSNYKVFIQPQYIIKFH